MKLSEKNKQRIAAILFILFFAIVWKCSGQTETLYRYPNHPWIVTYVPNTPMKFDGGNDTIYLSILADNVELHEYEYSLYCFFPRAVNNFSLQIDYTDGSNDIFRPTRVIDNYVEMDINFEGKNRIAYYSISSISFYNDGILQVCNRIRTRDYFINFFRQLK